MKCNNKKIQEYKENKAREQREQERKKYIETLTEEEKEQFFKDEKERQEKSLQIFNNLVNACSELGIKKYY